MSNEDKPCPKLLKSNPMKPDPVEPFLGLVVEVDELEEGKKRFKQLIESEHNQRKARTHLIPEKPKEKTLS